MELMFIFDDIVDQIINDRTDDSFPERVRYIQERHMASGVFEYWCVPIMIYSLYVICYETGKGSLMQYPDYISGDFPRFSCANVSYCHIMLYSRKNTKKIQKHILAADEHCYGGENSENGGLAMYHLIKNKFYEGIVQRLDKELSVTEDMYSMSRMMGIAVKNRDTECLELFLERGFMFCGEDMQFLLEKCRDHMTGQVIPLLEKYANKEAFNYE